jgi:hypothetical protein
MSIFKETLGTRCLGQADQNCENFKNRKLLPPTKRFCECGSKVEKIEKANWKTIGAAVVLGVVLVGGAGAAARYYVMNHLPGIPDMPSGPGSTPGKQKPNEPSTQTPVTLRIEADGASVPIEHTFRSGDECRFLMRGPSSARVYGFYEDRDSHKMTPLASGKMLDPDQDTNVPTGGAVKFDGNAGPETFEFVISQNEVPGLSGSESLDRASFDEQLKQLKRHGGLATGRLERDDTSAHIVLGNEKATLARLELIHR